MANGELNKNEKLKDSSNQNQEKLLDLLSDVLAEKDKEIKEDVAETIKKEGSNLDESALDDRINQLLKSRLDSIASEVVGSTLNSKDVEEKIDDVSADTILEEALKESSFKDIIEQINARNGSENLKTDSSVSKEDESLVFDSSVPNNNVTIENNESEEDKKTILIVEDEAITAMDLKFTLEDLGYKVIATVDNGQDAIDTAAEACPDLTIMDINLKGDMSGIEAAEKILEFNLPVIYLTANSDDTTFNRAVANSSAYAFLPKPFNPKIIKHNIDFAINRAGIESEKINLAHGFIEK